MMTARLERNWQTIPGGIATPAANGWTRGDIVRRPGFVFALPPTAAVMDPSDRSTWRRPVRWT